MDDLLTDDHSELDALLDELFSQLETGDAGRIFEKLDLFWARLAMHIRAEHLHLFPAILVALSSGRQTIKDSVFSPSLEDARKIIAELRADHDFFMRELTSAIKQIRRLLENKTPDDAETFSSVGAKISAVRRRLERHNELEETEIYQWAKMLLDSSAQKNLNERMKTELNNLPPRFSNT